jgi:hypothetical protein
MNLICSNCPFTRLTGVSILMLIRLSIKKEIPIVVDLIPIKVPIGQVGPVLLENV